MEVIVPSRSTISERFPIASFMVRVPAARYFEVVCATDPRLFHTSYAGQRTPNNFYTSRNDGMLVAQEGENTFFIPPQQLRRFAGARRIYYALGTYGGHNGESPRFSISPNALDEVPSIGLGADFTGRSLDRTRIGRRESPSAAYGSRNGAALRWGGDAALDAERAASSSPSPPLGAMTTVTTPLCGRTTTGEQKRSGMTTKPRRATRTSIGESAAAPR